MMKISVKDGYVSESKSSLPIATGKYIFKVKLGSRTHIITMTQSNYS